jgi:hypothetical protein
MSRLFNFMFLNMRPQCLFFKPHEQQTQSEHACFFSSDYAQHCLFKSINQKIQVRGIICDMNMAFNCVSLEILLDKLHFKAFKQVHTGLHPDIKQKAEISSNAIQIFLLKIGKNKTRGSPTDNSRLLPFIIHINDISP